MGNSFTHCVNVDRRKARIYRKNFYSKHVNKWIQIRLIIIYKLAVASKLLTFRFAPQKHFRNILYRVQNSPFDYCCSCYCCNYSYSCRPVSTAHYNPWRTETWKYRWLTNCLMSFSDSIFCAFFNLDFLIAPIVFKNQLCVVFFFKGQVFWNFNFLTKFVFHQVKEISSLIKFTQHKNFSRFFNIFANFFSSFHDWII